MTKLLFGGVLEKGYSLDARTDFDAKYVKRRGSAQGSAFWGRETKIKGFGPHFPPKPPFWAPFRRDLEFFSPENGFNIGGSKSATFDK